MKSLLLLLVPVMMLSLSCRKDKNSTADRMTFYSGYGMRSTNKIIMYQVDRKYLRKDDSARFTYGYVFHPTQVMGKEQFMVARELLENVPKELISANSKTFGAPGAHDQGGYVVIIEKGGVAKRFDIDEDNTPDQSKEVVVFKKRLVDVMRKLQ